jgi:hypothetical protein
MLEGRDLTEQEPIRRYLITSEDHGYIWRFALISRVKIDDAESIQSSVIAPCLIYMRVGRIDKGHAFDKGYVYEYKGVDI